MKRGRCPGYLVPELHAAGDDMKRTPAIIEFVGAAGAGKSTAAEELQKRCERIVLRRSPYFRRAKDVPFFTTYTLLSLPILVKFHLSRKQHGGLTPPEIVQLIILRGWCGVLRRQASAHGLTIVLEQGPVNMLAGLWCHGSDVFRSQGAEMWWGCTCNRWADTLDLLVWLDTSATTLVERARTRDKWHVVKELPDQAAFDRLSRHQMALDHVIHLLSSASRSLRVLRFDTGQTLPDQICEEIMAALWQ